MSDEHDAPARPSAPVEITLDGPGPFQLPICTDLKEIALGESVAILRLETRQGQRVDIPVPIGMLIEIGDAAEEGLQQIIRSRGPAPLQ